MSRPGTADGPPAEDAEKQRLEVEYFEAQRQLRDVQELNLNMQHENSIREEQIRQKEYYIANMRGKIKSEIQLIETEEIVLRDRIAHGILLDESSLSTLQSQHERLVNMERENTELRQAIRDMHDSVFEYTKKHANTMHLINRDVRIARTAMEATLRSELANLDLTYQKKAFYNLAEKKKKAMLRNSQLKDEISMQDIGINNLTTRLNNQEAGYASCMQDVKKMNRRAKRLRDRLGLLTSTKVCQAKILADVSKVEQEVQKKIDEITRELDKPPIISSLEDEILEYLKAIQQARENIMLWSLRLKSMQNIYFEIKPVGDYEATGAYKNKIFTINNNCRKREHTSYYQAQSSSRGATPIQSQVPIPLPLPSMTATDSVKSSRPKSITMPSPPRNLKSREKIAERKEEQNSTLTLSDILHLIHNDVDLMKVFEPVHKKEGCLVVADERTNQSSNQNMTAWLAYEILDLWDRSFATIHPPYSSFRNQSEVEHEFHTIMMDQRLKIPTNTIVTDGVVPDFGYEINCLVQKLVDFDADDRRDTIDSNLDDHDGSYQELSADHMSKDSAGMCSELEDGSGFDSEQSDIRDDTSEISMTSEKMFRNFSHLVEFRSSHVDTLKDVLKEDHQSLKHNDLIPNLQNTLTESDSCWYKKVPLPDKFPHINAGKIYSKDIFQRGLIAPRQTTGSLISRFPDNDIHAIRRLLKANRPMSPPRADSKRIVEIQQKDLDKSQQDSLIHTNASSVASFLSENRITGPIIDPLSVTRKQVKSSSNIPILCRSQSDNILKNTSSNGNNRVSKIEFKKVRASDFGYLTPY